MDFVNVLDWNQYNRLFIPSLTLGVKKTKKRVKKP